MRRAMETPGARLATKRQRTSSPALTDLLRPCFQASPLETSVDWTQLRDKLCYAPRASSTGHIWYATYKTEIHEDFQISVISPDGHQEIVADDLSGKLYNFYPRGHECLFLNHAGAICTATCSGGVSVLAESHSVQFKCYATGIVSIPRDRGRRFVERRELSGNVIQVVELDFDLPHLWAVSKSGRDLLFCAETVIEKVDLQTKARTIIAGSEDKGCCDGHGADARFNCLMLPSKADRNCFIVRDRQLDGTMRICRIDCTTHAVSTLDVRGFEDIGHVKHFAVDFPNVLLLKDDGTLLHANLSEDLHASTFSIDMRAVDWSETSPMDLQFKLGDSAVVRADRRVLCARSKYFAAMLDPERGFREAQGALVDLTSSPTDPKAFRAVLAYLATDQLDLSSSVPEGSDDEGEECYQSGPLLEHALFCAKVAALADQYQLPRLQGLAESFVTKVALPNCDALVLPVLEQVLGTGGAVEQACWEAFKGRSAAVYAAAGHEEIVKLLARSPQLGGMLLFHLTRLVSREESTHA